MRSQRARDRQQHDEDFRKRHQLQRARADGMPIHRRRRHEDHHRDQRGHRNAAYGLAKKQAQHEEEGAGEERRQARARLGYLDADHRLANHRAHAHTANGCGQYIANALAKGLAGLIGMGIRDVIDKLCR